MRLYRILALSVLLATSLNANATVDPSKVAKAVSGAIESKLSNRGFTPSDPRFAGTISRSTGVIRAATSLSTIPLITAGAVTAPAWMTASMVLATGAAIGYAASVGEESLTNWLLKEDGTVDVEGNPLPIDSSDGMTVGSSYWSASDYVNSMQGGDGFAVARQAYYNYMARGGNTNPQAPNCQQNNDTQIQCANIVAVFKPSGSLNMCGQGFYFANEQCKPYSYPAPSSVPAQSDLTAQQAVDSLPTSDLSRNLSPAYVAAVANIMWSRAAMEPGYDGVPYSNSKQITSNDVKAWMDANPNYTPTVADFTSPAPSSSSTAYTLPGTATSSAPQAINPNATSTPLNLGPDPAIDAPTLQSTPTAEAILSPALDLMPDLKNLVLPETTAECPKPILYVFDTEIEFSAHCILLEDYHLKEIIQGLMMFFWALAAAIVVLTA